MELGEKIKTARENRHMTQKQLAEAIGSSQRTIQYYESGQRHPQNATVILQLAEALQVKSDYFLSDNELERMQAQDTFLEEAKKQFGSRGKAQARQILDQASALFAGGDLDESDQEAFFEAMTEIYFDAKRKAKKYAPKHKKRREA